MSEKSTSSSAAPIVLWVLGAIFLIGIASAYAVAAGFDKAYEAFVLCLYAIVGFFSAASVLYFFGGFIVYLARLGQEYRQEGLYHMLHGVRIFIYVLWAALLLKLLD